MQCKGKTVDRSYFDNRVSRRKYEQARQSSIKWDRGCTCAADLARCEYSDQLYGRRCWFCNENDK